MPQCANRKQVLIVGYGDIGQRVAKLGVTAGWRLHALVRSSRLLMGVEPIVGDLDQAVSLHNLETYGGCDVLLHFAPPAPNGENDSRTVNLLAALEHAPPRRIVYISTSGVYGDCGGAWVMKPARFILAMHARAVVSMRSSSCTTLLVVMRLIWWCCVFPVFTAQGVIRWSVSSAATR